MYIDMSLLLWIAVEEEAEEPSTVLFFRYFYIFFFKKESLKLTSNAELAVGYNNSQGYNMYNNNNSHRQEAEVAAEILRRD